MTQATRRAVLAAGTATLGTAGAVGFSVVRDPGSGARTARQVAATTPLGRSMQRVVKDYSQWRLHRTGTAGSRAAVDWVEGELRRRGATTDRWSYRYPHYAWSADVRAGERRIPTVPYYYEGVGEVSTGEPYVAAIRASDAGEDPELRSAIDAAEASGAPLAVLAVSKPATATASSYAGLVAFNSDPSTRRRRSGVPTLIVPGRAADAFQENGVSVSFRSRTRRRRADNVTAWLGTRQPVKDPVVVTTPLSGWFRCAGERGTGLAVALQLAEDLAQDQPVFFLGNTGHELENYGVRRWLADAFDLEPRAVVHLGASIAAGTRDLLGTLRLGVRGVASDPSPALAPRMTLPLTRGSFVPVTSFPGEGAEWDAALPAGTPLISFAGTFREFHTPDDRARRVTSPALLATAYGAVSGAVSELLAAT